MLICTTPRNVPSRYSRNIRVFDATLDFQSRRGPHLVYFVSHCLLPCSALAVRHIDISRLVQAGAVPRLNESYCSPRGQRRVTYPYFHSLRRAKSQPIRLRGMHHSRAPGHHIRSTHCTILLHNNLSARLAPKGRTPPLHPSPRTGQSCVRAALSTPVAMTKRLWWKRDHSLHRCAVLVFRVGERLAAPILAFLVWA